MYKEQNCDYVIVKCQGAECVDIWSLFCLELAGDGKFLSRVHEDWEGGGGQTEAVHFCCIRQQHDFTNSVQSFDSPLYNTVTNFDSVG